MPIFKTYLNAGGFLKTVQADLEAAEAANNLIYGLALQIERSPERFRPLPFFGAVRDGQTLLAAALMTPPHNLVVYAGPGGARRDVFMLLARSLRDADWPVPGVLGPNEAALAFANAWRELTGEDYALRLHERVYELHAVQPPPHPGGQMRQAGLDEVELAAQWQLAFHQEAMPDDGLTLEEARAHMGAKIADGAIFLWEDGEPVALAGQSRSTPHGCCIGPVYTPPTFRCRGYARALTAALSQRLLDSGKQFTALFTDLANPTSNSIYQQIGYRPVCDFDNYSFRPAQR